MKSVITLLMLLITITASAVCQTTTSEALPGSVQQREMHLNPNNYKLPIQQFADQPRVSNPTNPSEVFVEKIRCWDVNTISEEKTNYVENNNKSNMPMILFNTKWVEIHTGNGVIPIKFKVVESRVSVRPTHLAGK